MARIVSIILILTISLSGSGFAQTISQKVMSSIQKPNDDDGLNEPTYAPDKANADKSKYKALGLSILLPGAGQYYVGSKKKMVIFASAEALIWSGFFGFRMYGSWKKEDYKAWAAFHAGADINGKSDRFFEKMTYYDNVNEFNQLELLYEGTNAQPFPSNSSYYWNWDFKSSKDHYRNLRNLSKTAYRRSLLFIGAAIANRILSGIDAYRAANAYNSGKEFSEKGWQIYSSSDSPLGAGGFEIGLALKF